MTDALQFDERASRSVEAIYRTSEAVEQRRATVRLLDPRPGERILDLGCGPGYLACDLHEAVGPTGSVHGVDSSSDMLDLARARTGPRPAIELSRQGVTALSFGDATFDAAVSTQVYEYVEDTPAALAEARRVLVPGGRLLVLDTDWDSIVWHSTDDERMRRVLRAWDGHVAHRDLPRRLPQLLAEGGFALQRCSVVPFLNVGYEPGSFSSGVIDLIAAFVSAREGLSAEDVAVWAADLRSLGRAYFFSLNRYLFLATS